MTTTTTATGRTDSTVELLKTIRAALLIYANAAGDTARDIIAERLFQGRAPDNQVFPYAVMRASSSNDGRYQGLRRIMAIEILVFGRPWSQLADANNLCDLFDQAMTYYVANAHGLMFAYAFQRDQLPPGSAPVDSETVTIRVVYTLAIWPDYLTSIT